MAARKPLPTKLQQDQTRAAIQTTQLVKRLQCFALNKTDDAGNVVDLDAGRIKAIEILLKKALPDLQAVTVESGANGFVVTLAPATAQL